MKHNILPGIILIGSLLVGGCNNKPNTMDEAKSDSTRTKQDSVHKELFGTLPSGEKVYRYVLRNEKGLEVHVINYGAVITHLKTPDKYDVIGDVVLGYDSLSDYLNDSPYFGAIVGRYGNRIAKGKFKIDGQEYTLAQNNNGEHLHGGNKGFDKVFWKIDPFQPINGQALKLTYLSKDGEEGYPGNLQVTVEYILSNDNTFTINYKATTDKKTVVNLTQHSYFNLTGNFGRDILAHELTLYADKYVPTTKTLIPTGELASVKNTPFDFNKATAIGKRINEDHQQLKFAGGYDHCWVLSSNDSLRKAATLYEPTSGRYLEIQTTEPAIQFYSGNFLNGTNIGKGGVTYAHRYGLCLETQHFPDSPNQPKFPTVILEPGEEYSTKTVYTFSAK